MKTKKKNRFLTFCFSLMPGAAEMYMGFMKSGISLMMLFFLVILFGVMIGQGAFAVFCVVIWFYGFFHANHLASLSDEEFGEVKDEYLFGMEELPGLKSFVQKYRSWVAGAMILIGICLLWNAITSLLYEILPQQLYFIVEVMWRIGDFVPSLVVGAGIILLGIRMLRGKEAVLADTQAEAVKADTQAEAVKADAAVSKEQEEKN